MLRPIEAMVVLGVVISVLIVAAVSKTASALGGCSIASSTRSHLTATRRYNRMERVSALFDTSSSSSSSIGIPSWSNLQEKSVRGTAVGKALDADKDLRKTGRGEAHVTNTIRLFDKPDGYHPMFTLYRDEVRNGIALCVLKSYSTLLRYSKTNYCSLVYLIDTL